MTSEDDLRINKALSGEWELLQTGEFKGYLAKMVSTDMGFCWVIAKLIEHDNNEATIRIVCTKRHLTDTH